MGDKDFWQNFPSDFTDLLQACTDFVDEQSCEKVNAITKENGNTFKDTLTSVQKRYPLLAQCQMTASNNNGDKAILNCDKCLSIM